MLKSFYLENADAKQIAAMIKTMVKTKDVFVDEKLNLVIMRDTPDAVRFAEQLVSMQDKPEPEVMLEVEVLEVSTSRLLNLGINYPTQVSYGAGAVAGGAAAPATISLADLRNVATPNLVQFANPVLVANLQQQDGDTNLLANPRVRVKNHEKAKILIGDRVPVITTTSGATGGFVSQSVNYLDVGLKLDVEPTIYLDSDVGIKVGLEVSSIVKQVTSGTGSGATLTYQIGTRSANTVLRLHDGETQVLAGLINNEERNSANKVPGLGDIPLIGKLFSSNNNTKNKTEIVLLITPHVVRNIARPDADKTEFKSGTEAAVGRVMVESKAAPEHGRVQAPADVTVAPPVAPVPSLAQPLTPVATQPIAPVVTVPVTPVAAPQVP